MAIRSALTRVPRRSPPPTMAAARRWLTDSEGRILSEEQRAKENVYIQKMERERREKLRRKAEREKASSGKPSTEEMSSSQGSKVRRTRTVDSAPDPTHQAIVPHIQPTPQSVPTAQGPSGSASVPSSIAETSGASTWGRGTGRRGPTRGVTERRLDPGQRWNVRVVGGYGVGEQGTSFVSRMGTVIRMHCKPWQKNFSKLAESKKNAIFRDLEVTYQWDRTAQTDKEMLQHMTTMHKGWRGMLKSRYYKGKTLEDAIASVPAGVDPLDWHEMCEKWNTKEEQDVAERNRQNRTHQTMTYRRGRTSIYQLKDDFEKTHQRQPDRIEVFKMGRCKDLVDGTQRWVDDESSSRYKRMTQLMTPDLDSDAHTSPVSAEDAFVAVMGRDRPGRVRCAGKAETLGSWYGRSSGSSSGGCNTRVQQLEQQVQAQSRQIDELREERSTDKKQMEDLRADMAKMQALIEQLASQRSHTHVVSGREGGAGEDESADDFYDDDE